jgi:hypothetical protein
MGAYTRLRNLASEWRSTKQKYAGTNYGRYRKVHPYKIPEKVGEQITQ